MSEQQNKNDEQVPSSGFDSEMAEILESFFIESNEIIDHLGRDLLALEKTTNDAELLNKIFRGIHTLKGKSSFLGFNQMAEFTHRFEDLLNMLRKGERVVNPTMMDTIFEVVRHDESASSKN